MLNAKTLTCGLGLLVAVGFTAAEPLHAQASAPPLIVIVQSGLGADGGETLRAQLAERFALSVVAVSNPAAATRPPRAVLTIAIDDDAMLRVFYWDDRGVFEVLSAPAPVPRDARNTAVLTLASATLQRHLDALRDAAPTLDQVPLVRSPASAPVMVARTSPRMGRLAVALRWEDF